MKKRRGMTILEVVIAFVLMGIIASLVSGVMTGAYAMSAKLTKMPNAYYGAQAEVEEYMKVLKEYAEAERNLKELTADGAGSDEITAAQADLDKKKKAKDQINDYHETVKIKVFEKNVDVYRCSQTVSKDGATFFLCGGVSAAGRLKRAVPRINSVEIKFFGGDGSSKRVTEVYYNGMNKSLGGTLANVSDADGRSVGEFVGKYSAKNANYLKAEFYQWYESTGTTHAMPFDEPTTEQDEYNYTINTSYPTNFTPIAGETNLKIDIKDKYKGKFLVLVVTPLSKSGTVGNPVASNIVYISPVPKLNSGNYAFIVDSSWWKIAKWSDKRTGTISLSGVDYSDLLIPGIDDKDVSTEFNGSPSLNIKGENTSSNASLTTYSRYIDFKAGSYLELESKRDSKYVYLVIKSDEVEAAIAELKNNSAEKPTLNVIRGLKVDDVWPKTNQGNNGWRIVRGKFDGEEDEFSVGNVKCKVAEVIGVTERTNDADKKAIENYLSKKYGIGLN